MAVKKMIGKLIYKEVMAGNTWLLGLSLDEISDFIPGQYVSMKVTNEGLRRSYSVASMPGDKSIELVIDISPGGVGSKYVMELEVGDEIDLIGFMGKFFVEEEALSSEEMLFVGTGTGIVPLKVMIEDLLINKQYKGKVNLVWGMRYEADLYWQGEIDKLQREYDNFHLFITLSRPDEKWPGVSSHVGDVVEKMDLDNNKTRAYICGNPDMILEMKKMIVNKGVSEDKILFERYA